MLPNGIAGGHLGSQQLGSQQLHGGFQSARGGSSANVPIPSSVPGGTVGGTGGEFPLPDGSPESYGFVTGFDNIDSLGLPPGWAKVRCACIVHPGTPRRKPPQPIRNELELESKPG